MSWKRKTKLRIWLRRAIDAFVVGTATMLGRASDLGTATILGRAIDVGSATMLGRDIDLGTATILGRASSGMRPWVGIPGTS